MTLIIISDREQIDILQIGHRGFGINFYEYLWFFGYFEFCVSCAVVYMKMPVVSLEAEPRTYLRKTAVCL